MWIQLHHFAPPVQRGPFANTLGQAALGLGLLVAGAGLHLRGVIRPTPVTLVTAALKLVVMPAIAIALAKLIGVTGTPLMEIGKQMRASGEA